MLQEVQNTTLYVSNFSRELGYDGFKAIFNPFGKTNQICIFSNPKIQIPYAFIQYDDLRDAVAAKKAINNKLINGLIIKVQYKKNKQGSRSFLNEPPQQNVLQRTYSEGIQAYSSNQSKPLQLNKNYSGFQIGQNKIQQINGEVKNIQLFRNQVVEKSLPSFKFTPHIPNQRNEQLTANSNKNFNIFNRLHSHQNVKQNKQDKKWNRLTQNSIINLSILDKNKSTYTKQNVEQKRRTQDQLKKSQIQGYQNDQTVEQKQRQNTKSNFKQSNKTQTQMNNNKDKDVKQINKNDIQILMGTSINQASNYNFTKMNMKNKINERKNKNQQISLNDRSSSSSSYSSRSSSKYHHRHKQDINQSFRKRQRYNRSSSRQKYKKYQVYRQHNRQKQHHQQYRRQYSRSRSRSKYSKQKQRRYQPQSHSYHHHRDSNSRIRQRFDNKKDYNYTNTNIKQPQQNYKNTSQLGTGIIPMHSSSSHSSLIVQNQRETKHWGANIHPLPIPKQPTAWQLQSQISRLHTMIEQISGRVSDLYNATNQFASRNNRHHHNNYNNNSNSSSSSSSYPHSHQNISNNSKNSFNNYGEHGNKAN